MLSRPSVQETLLRLELLRLGRTAEPHEPEPAVWELGVTTCIAAIASDHTIVSASDTKMSFSGGDFSVEGVIKAEPFHGQWTAMIGGNDVSQAIPVIERATRLLRDRDNDFLMVMSGFKQAYRDQYREVLSDSCLGPTNMTLNEFKKDGKRLLHEAVYGDVALKILDFRLGCTFLVHGYDQKKVPHIFEVRNPGKATVHDKPGFWALGSGASAALSLLAQLGQTRESTSMADTIYNVLAAKFSSESADGVGKETFFIVQKYGSIAFTSQGHLKRAMRQLWDDKGRPRIPPEAAQIVEGAQIDFWYSPKKKPRAKESEDKPGI